MTKLACFNYDYLLSMDTTSILELVNNIVEEHNNIDSQLTSRNTIIETQHVLIENLKVEIFDFKSNHRGLDQFLKGLIVQAVEQYTDQIEEIVTDKVDNIIEGYDIPDKAQAMLSEAIAELRIEVR